MAEGRKRRRWLPTAIVLVVLVGAGLAAAKYTGLIGGPGPAATIGVDLPYQGATTASSTETFNAMQLYLDQRGGKVADTTVTLVNYDDATSAKLTWDEARCTANAQAHLARADEVAVIGPEHVGCARAEAKVLAGAGMVMVSPAVTNPGLTTTWGSGEPGVYAVNGVRSFARVVPTDDAQAAAAGVFASSVPVSRCLVVNDGELYGQRLAQRFADAARAKGLTITDGGTWDRSSSSYLDLFGRGQGADCVYLAGNFDNNGQQLITDKVAALGDNDRVKLFVPDGFGAYPTFLSLPAAQHAYVTTPGLTMDAWRSLKSKVREFLAAYKDKYHVDLTSPQSLYGVLALQVVLRAMEMSDGSRAGVHQAMLAGNGVTLSADVCITGASTGIVAGTGDVTTPTISVGRVDTGAVTFVSTAVQP